MAEELVKKEPAQVSTILWTRDQMDLLKSQIAKGASDDELKLFMHVCQRTGLDPFARQIYAVVRKDKDSPNGKKMTIQTSIDGFRLIAQRSREYAGQVGPQWCGPDGVWCDVWLQKDAPAAARVGVLRVGFREPVWAVALWSEFCQIAYGVPTAMWKNMPTMMIAKCAEAQALRRVFPMELSGVYTEEEMGQADNIDAGSVEWTDEERQQAKNLINDFGQILMDGGLTEEAISVILDSKNSRQMATLYDPETPFEKWANRWITWTATQLDKHLPKFEEKA